MAKATTKPNQADAGEQTRKAILSAASREFSQHGLAGARTDTIAELAGVNKALIYYYFKSKSGLYAAAVEEAAGMVVERTLAALDPGHSAGERLLRAALDHFDRMVTRRDFQRLLQQEMVRFGRGESEPNPVMVKRFFEPLLRRLQQTVEEGIQTGELCDLDWTQVVYSVLGANVFYVLSAPMMRLALPLDPFDVATITARRESVMKFLGNALFVDRARGAQVAQHVLEEMPRPAL